MSLAGGIVFPSSSSAGCDNLGSLVSQSLSDSSKERIASIADEVKQLTDVEKLLLYLQLPTSSASTDHHKMKGISMGKKADVELAQTYAWIQTHLEEDSTVSLPKQEVYEDYRLFSIASKFEPMCVADFGKAMKHIFPTVKPRRLGQRGNSKYCYSGLKKKVKVETPELPSIDLQKGSASTTKKSDEDMFVRIVLTWAEKLTENRFVNISDLAAFLVSTQRIDPDDLKLDCGWLSSASCKKIGASRCSSQEPSRKKRSASGSDLEKQNELATSIPVDKIPIPRLPSRKEKIPFPPPPPPPRTQGQFKKIKPRTNESLMMDSLNGSSKRRHSVSAPSTLVSSPQLDIQPNMFNETVTQTDNHGVGVVGYPVKHVDDIASIYHQQQQQQQSARQSSQLVQSLSLGDQASYGEFLSEESVNEGSSIVHDDASDQQISQLRKLLEKNLPHKLESFEPVAASLQGFSDLRDNLQRKSVSTELLTFQTDASCPVTMEEKFDPSQVDAVNFYSRQTQYPSVPVSPNSRRNDFTFQPISVSSSASLDIQVPFQGKSVIQHLNNMDPNPFNEVINSPPMYHFNQQSVAVGTSEPPSGTNSPFLSPRETPTPVNRSRNDSGQSSMSFMRQTPYTIGDSGVSSIASSPFISPQTTPIPHRVRTGSGHVQRACQSMRSRHSSGPGNHCFVRNTSMELIGQFQSIQNDSVSGNCVAPFSEHVWDRRVDASRSSKMLNAGRHRHLSSPYSLNNHYMDEMKNYFRSHSVPAAREAGFGEQHLQSVPENYSMSKNDEFDQSTSPNAETNRVMRRDVMVSGMSKNHGWNQDTQVRRNITASLDIAPEGDELQTAIEDLRDFDNDYSDFEQLIALSEPVAVAGDLV